MSGVDPQTSQLFVLLRLPGLCFPLCREGKRAAPVEDAPLLWEAAAGRELRLGPKRALMAVADSGASLIPSSAMLETSGMGSHS